MDAAPQPPRPAALRVIFLVVFLDLVGFGIVIPQLGIYAHQFGASGTEVGLLGAAYSFAQFLAAPWLGRLSDRIGRRPVLIGSLAGSVFGYLVFAAATSLPLLFLGRLLQGIAGANISAAQAYIADVTSPAERAKSIGMYLGAAFGLGFIFGPAIGSVLTGHGNLGLGVAAAAMSLAALVVALIKLPESLPPTARGQGVARPGFVDSLGLLRHRPMALVVAVFVPATLAFSMMEGVFSLFIVERYFPGATGEAAKSAGTWTGLVFVTIGVVSTVVQGGLIGRLRARFGEPSLVRFGTSAMALGLFGLPLAPEVGWLFPCSMVLALGSGLNNPSLSSLVSQVAPAGRSGEAIGVYQGMGSLARTVGPALGGLLFERLGAQGAFWGGSGVMLLALAAAFGLETTKGPAVAPDPSSAH